MDDMVWSDPPPLCPVKFKPLTAISSASSDLMNTGMASPTDTNLTIAHDEGNASLLQGITFPESTCEEETTDGDETDIMDLTQGQLESHRYFAAVYNTSTAVESPSTNSSTTVVSRSVPAKETTWLRDTVEAQNIRIHQLEKHIHKLQEEIRSFAYLKQAVAGLYEEQYKQRQQERDKLREAIDFFDAEKAKINEENENEEVMDVDNEWKRYALRVAQGMAGATEHDMDKVYRKIWHAKLKCMAMGREA
ncbi:uncharacterized protein F5Z01DRAFT_32101 [Emericellopsis atlantica]|uniref:Uncharacterized protein n=1 Tax=Emericellopsis atlantica TaxID=2614577 RepID=A0A9P7ZY94_9HYPO|nr:uncharacterized protein F5Z01DRAFT_32101 [Emericellopsis atlantica]KAG9259218.1 hypothetical protein F5Z01DRAFT_32101 [Emericellopsis atlantica]